ncbi:MAG: molecular chaperone DnaJ [Solirubrobacterales bacterium]
MPRDYYEVLGVDRDADEGQIKKAFRRLARDLHPDVNTSDPEAENKFKEAAEAYEVLSDSERRATYDRYGHEGLKTGGYQPGGGGFGGFEEIFEQFFGGGGGGGSPFGDIFGGGGRRGPAQGGDVASRVEVSLEEVLSGVEREVPFEAVVRCERCNGNGAEPGTPIETCETCNGQGAVRQISRTPLGQVVRQGACPACRGEGKIPRTPCTECDGDGRKVESKVWQVDVPAGIESGQRIRISGAGHTGEPGAPAGDLYVEVVVADDERFNREGTTLVQVVELPTTTAMIGAKIEVETLEGPEEVEIEAGVQHGERIKLRGRGMPELGGGRRGDLYLVCNLVTPVKLTASQRELAERLDGSLEQENLPGSGGIFHRLRRAFQGR